ncbi:MAG: D-Ala-D-Ala carboxypeptidase family metallohydrolase [Paraclostridium sp.]
MAKISNFKYSEIIKSETAEANKIDNNVPRELYDNMLISHAGMQLVRKILGNKPIITTSWYRCEKLNKLVNGSTTSSHKDCLAVDFVVNHISHEKAFKLIKDSDLQFDQLIYEQRGQKVWIHIGFGSKNRRQAFQQIK